MSIIGQNKARSEADNIVTIFAGSQGVIRPHFWLSGPSGSGKTILVEYLAKRNNIDLITINAAQITKEGTSGNSISKSLGELRNRSGQLTICLVDETDKLFISGNNNELAHEITHGVQNEFLKILEGKTTSIFSDYGKYIDADVSKVLFIFAGAWNNADNVDVDFLRDKGVKTEFLGRVPLIVSTTKLTLEDLMKILDKEPLLNHYMELFSDANLEKVKNDIGTYLKNNYEYNTLGARQIIGLIHRYFINKGELNAAEISKTNFTRKLTLTDNSSQD
jgi:ATP-dependent protease Clp ATPase subunit